VRSPNEIAWMCFLWLIGGGVLVLLALVGTGLD
jgi:hypothetical protein